MHWVINRRNYKPNESILWKKYMASVNYLSSFEIPFPVSFLAPLAPRAAFGAPLWKPIEFPSLIISLWLLITTSLNSFWVSYSCWVFFLRKLAQIDQNCIFLDHVFSLCFSCLIVLFRLLRLNTPSPCSQAWHCKIIRTVAWGLCGKRARQCGSSAVQGQFSVIHNCAAISFIFKCTWIQKGANIVHKKLKHLP